MLANEFNWLLVLLIDNLSVSVTLQLTYLICSFVISISWMFSVEVVWSIVIEWHWFCLSFIPVCECLLIFWPYLKYSFELVNLLSEYLFSCPYYVFLFLLIWSSLDYFSPICTVPLLALSTNNEMHLLFCIHIFLVANLYWFVLPLVV